MENLATRLEQAMKKAGHSQSSLARAVDTSQQTINQLLAGKTGRSKFLPEIADVLRVDLKWLLHGGETPSTPAARQAAEKLHPTVTQAMPQDLPIYGDPSSMTDSFPLNYGDAISYIGRPSIFANNARAFAVYATGHDMEPRYSRGELLLIDPARPAQNSDYVLIESKDGSALVRQLIDVTSESIVVFQLNPEREYSIPRDEVVHIYKISGSYDI